MKISGIMGTAALAAALVTSAWFESTLEAREEFALAGVIPNDVFLYQGTRKNKNREFLDRYWGEVRQAVKESGVADDVIELFATAMGLEDEQTAEIERIKQRLNALLGEIDWASLSGQELAFAERFVPPTEIVRGRPTIMAANIVWLARGDADRSSKNFAGIVSLLEACIEEANHVLGREAWLVQRRSEAGAEIASINILATVPGAPELPLTVALKDDILLIAFREDLFADVLAQLNGDSKKTSLADDARFQAAFADLGPAEDSIVYFDMQALVSPMHTFFDTLFDEIAKPGDVYRNTGKSEKVSKLTARAMAAYHRGDIREALTVSQEAHDIGPDDCIVLYNLACFNALLGNRDEALRWLEKAVDGGFYAPRKIAIDADLESLRDEQRYQAAVAKAAQLARTCCAEDVAINCTNTGEVMGLRLQVRQAYEKKDYERAFQLIEQAHAVAPKDSQVLYIMGCLHTRLGREKKGLDFLEQAIEGGFYCPNHISQDPDWESVREDPRYQAVLTKASNLAAEETARTGGTTTRLVMELVGRGLDCIGVVDHVATIQTVDGYSVRTTSRATLMPDAVHAEIYPVFGKRPQLENFARYLPEETASFSVSNGLDLGALYNYLEGSYERAGPLGSRLLSQWRMLQGQLGLDVRRDVIDWIDGGSISVTLADRGGSVLLLKVTNQDTAREKLNSAFKALPDKIAAAIRSQPKLAALAGFAAMAPRTVPLEDERLEGFQAVQLGMSIQPVGVWGVADGFLIFGSSADAVAVCLATGRGEHPNIRSNARAMESMIVPDGPFSSLSLSDRHLGEEQAVAIGVASMMTGMLVAAAPDPKLRPVLGKVATLVGKIGPIVRKINFYESSASCITTDGHAWYTRSVTHYLSPEERAAKTAK